MKRSLKVTLCVVALIISLGIVCLGLAIIFADKSESVKIGELNYVLVFNDKNDVQLRVAKQLGIKKPLKNRKDEDEVKDGLVRIRDNSHYSIAKLTHSIPYLTEGDSRTP